MDDLMPDINGSGRDRDTGPDLFSASAAEAAKEEAIDRVREHAPEEWMDAAQATIHAIAMRQREITTDDLWRELPKPPEPRAMGAAIRAAARAGVIGKTGRYQPSEREACHGRPIAIWRSLLRDA